MSCDDENDADVYLPDAVKLFFRRSNHNDVVSHRWLQRNDTRLQIFGSYHSSESVTLLLSFPLSCFLIIIIINSSSSSSSSRSADSRAKSKTSFVKPCPIQDRQTIAMDDLTVCQSVTRVGCAKTAERIDVLLVVENLGTH